MLITGFPAGMFATNCYVVAQHPGSDAIIIDPGQDAAPGVRKLLAEHELNPVAVLLTHGHLDHTWNATELCDEYGIPAFIHPADRHMLADPAAGIGRALGAMIGDTVFREPDKVIDLVDREDLEVAGLKFSVDLAPGHTQGSVLFGIAVDTPDGQVPVCFSGDVLFAGSIGRTDLPGGDHQQLLDSIAERMLPLPDETVVLPGHGEQTSIGQERASNPFLVDLPGAGQDGTTNERQKGRHGL
ncbi:MBL fold metallo-hydrolase [Williamsia sp. 1135]|uniref:MBL fold metallo-hydrolase n=1 Tax=Williamsia sp. 1135 TaxID=1889262 RepID=UPI000A0F8C93|nr:MBL fold metallo-hydrolase [Williamsia sp. 1135]ORM24037.1 MBL fold metallo-hydrolase [Williamsia sp. 1135]